MQLEELTAVVAKVLHQHVHCVFSVRALLFVPQAKAVSNLVHRSPELYNMTIYCNSSFVNAVFLYLSYLLKNVNITIP